MLQSSFNIIKEHFSPSSTVGKSIFLTKDYDYPSPFVQQLYLSYLELQQMLRTKSSDEIARRINTVSTKNDRNFHKVVLGLVYALMLHSSKSRDQSSQNQKVKGGLMDAGNDAQLNSQKIVSQVTQYFTIFRAQAWTLFNTITLQLLTNHLSEIKPSYRFGFISIFRQLCRTSFCSDNLFLGMLKTLNFYDQTTMTLRYNLELLTELGEILGSWRNMNSDTTLFKEQSQNNYSKGKVQDKVSLMRLYLFGKLLNWQFMSSKMKTYMKGEWPYYLQRLCVQGLKMLKGLYNSKPQQCMVFSGQWYRYADFPTTDPQMQQILHRVIKQSSRQLDPSMMQHHYSLLPLSIQLLLPFQLQQTLNQLSHTLYRNQQSRPQKANIHMILNWAWKQYQASFSEDNNTKNYLLENVLPDVMRWCLMSHTKSLEMRIYVMEWVMYQGMQNQIIGKALRHAFFQDWLYFLKVAPQMDFNSMFGTLTTSIYILNYFSFYLPNVAETLFVFILSKNIQLKAVYQTGPISQGLFRSYINQVLKRAGNQGLLRVREITYQSQLSNSIKNQLQLRLYEAQQNPAFQIEKQNSMDKAKQQPYQHNLIEEEKPLQQQMQYYGDKNLNVAFDLKPQTVAHGQEQDDLIYTSHQLIPSSPSYHELEEIQHPAYNKVESSKFQLQHKQGLKRDSTVTVHQLEQQAQLMQEVEKKSIQPQQKTQSLKAPQISIKAPPQSLQENSNSKQHYSIKLQKQFVQQMGTQITLLLNNPTISQFTEYMKQFTKVLKDYKKSSLQQEIIQTFLQQTSKILYLAFNKEFQSFQFNSQQQPKESRYLTYFLLKSINQYWKQALTVYSIFIYKKLVKCLCEEFRSCEFAFYLAFLDIFRKGVPHYRDIKPWLFDKESQKYVIPVLQRILGKDFKMHIYQNAQINQIHNSNQGKRKHQDQITPWKERFRIT